MIMTVEELKKYVNSSDADDVLEARLQALELLIRKETNNNFQNRNKRYNSPIVNGNLNTYLHIKDGDTVQISQSKYNDGVYVFSPDMGLIDEPYCLVTKIEYPVDIKMGVANMMKWDIDNRNKVGIQSETLSRHSVTYFNMDGDNSSIGFPKSLTGFLNPYRKARF